MNDYFKKSYLVKFTDNRNGYTFLKFGATNDYDILKRFKHEPHQYRHYTIDPICSIYLNVNTPNEGKGGVIESYFLKKYPRNTPYFEENFSGISETYKPRDYQEESKIKKEFWRMHDRIKENGELVDNLCR